MKIIFFKTTAFAYLLLLGLLIQAQTKIGDWRAFPSYGQIVSMSINGNTAFCAAENAALVYNSDGNFQLYSKINGLSDNGLNLAAYSEENKVGIFTFSSGIIDLIFKNKIYSIKSVKEKRVGETHFFDCAFINQSAYLATNFGVLHIDLQRREVKETYFLGETGEEIAVYDIIFHKEQNAIWAATERGILKGELDGQNLMDFANWRRLDNRKFNKLESLGNKIFGVTTDESNTLYSYLSDNWSVAYTATETINSINQSNDKLFFCSGNKGFSINKNGEINEVSQTTTERSSIGSFLSGDLLQAGNEGLLLNGNSVDLRSPKSDVLNSLHSYNSTVWITGTDFAQSFNEEQWWTNENSYLKALPSKVSNETWLISSEGKLYKKQQETLEEIAVGNFTDIQADVLGKIWVSNRGTDFQLLSIDPNGEQRKFTDPGLSNLNISQLLLLPSEDKWMLVNGKIHVYNENNTEIKHKSFSAIDEDSKTLSPVINCLSLDKESIIWCGSNNGLFYYPNPASVFYTEGAPIAYRAIVEENEEANYLLKDNIITCIAVDGGNRKWIGTRRAGLFLLSADGNQILRNFTSNNSPLLSNEITHLAIDNLSGELFISTPKGLVSYRTESIEGKISFGDAYIYPNPVRPEYTGNITITGLMTDTEVKIADTAGKLVFETQSIGGQATWNGKNMRGERVASGVYFIFLTGAEGEEREVLKLLFIN